MVEVGEATRLDYPGIAREIEESSVTQRTFKSYCDFFGYSPANLSGKLILDVGAGESPFANEAARFNARVIRLDAQYPQYGFPRDKKDKIIGDDVFDETIAAYCLWWITTEIRRSLLEMIRVTKPNGKIKVHPVLRVGRLGKFSDIFKGKPLAIEEAEPGARYALTIEKRASYTRYEWEPLVDKLMSSVLFSPE